MQQMYFHGQEKEKLWTIIKEKTGYCFRSNCILSQAFRRSSYCAENGGKSNELFEFIGDHILSYYMVKLFTERCSSLNIEGDYTFRISENRLTALKQELLSNEAFAKIVDEWGVEEYLLVGRSDEKNQVKKQTKTKADLFEAIIGAIAVESNWDPVILETTVNRALNIDERINSIIENEYYSISFDMDNAVSKLKELAEKGICGMPHYDFSGPEQLGYDKNGNPIWSCSCCVINDVTAINRLVIASSKKDAKKAVAYLVLCEHFQAQNKYGINDFCILWYFKDGKLIPGRLTMKK